MCLYPKLIKNRKYLPNKKNKGYVPTPNDDRVLFVPVGCGRCIECMNKKKREWQVRLTEEIRVNKNGKFITLTFSDESLLELEKDYSDVKDSYIRDNLVATLGVRRFLERWRKKYKMSVRHWLITELGQNNTERIHLHGILFTDVDENTIKDIWKYGNIWIGKYVNEKTINYIIKYVSKQDDIHKNYIPKILCSKGIGKGYFDRYNSKLNVFKGEDTKEYYLTRQGYKLSLPIYYRNMLYNDEEKEKLWLQMLDREVRFVCGEEVSVSDGDEDYIKLRDFYREKNNRLGYNSDLLKWDEKQYKIRANKLRKRKNVIDNDINNDDYLELKKDSFSFAKSSGFKSNFNDILNDFNNGKDL